MKSSKQLLNAHLKRQNAWISNTSVDLHAETTKHLDTAVTKGVLTLSIASSLALLAGYFGTIGTVALLSGEKGGWQHVHHACLLHDWSLRIHLAYFRRSENPRLLNWLVQRVANLLCYSITINEVTLRRHQAELLSEMASNDSMVELKYWKHRSFEPFVRRLDQILSDDTLRGTQGQSSYGVYGDLFCRWEEESKFASVIDRVCDYHCQNLIDHGEWRAEFDDPPFDLIPWEILAIREVRRQQGLSMPEVEHPLLNPAVMNVEMPGPIEDEYIAKIEPLYEAFIRGE